MKEHVLPFEIHVRGHLHFEMDEYSEMERLAERLVAADRKMRSAPFNGDVSNFRDIVEAFEQLATIPAPARASAHSREEKESDDET